MSETILSPERASLNAAALADQQHFHNIIAAASRFTRLLSFLGVAR